jgi:hypothetical protein
MGRPDTSDNNTVYQMSAIVTCELCLDSKHPRDPPARYRTSPSRMARATASVRVLVPSLDRISLT